MWRLKPHSPPQAAAQRDTSQRRPRTGNHFLSTQDSSKTFWTWVPRGIGPRNEMEAAEALPRWRPAQLRIRQVNSQWGGTKLLRKWPPWRAHNKLHEWNHVRGKRDQTKRSEKLQDKHCHRLEEVKKRTASMTQETKWRNKKEMAMTRNPLETLEMKRELLRF